MRFLPSLASLGRIFYRLLDFTELLAPLLTRIEDLEREVKSHQEWIDNMK